MSRLTCPTPYKILTVFVCVSGAVLGGFFGRPPYRITGLYVAGIGGILAGLFWSYMMLRRIREGSIGGDLVARGIGWGFVVGMADTLVLHTAGIILVGLYVADIWLVLFICTICGAVVGAVNGLICGLIWNAVAKKYPI